MHYRFGVVLGSFEGWYHQTMLRGLERAARILGVQLIGIRNLADLPAFQGLPLQGILLNVGSRDLSNQNINLIRSHFSGLPLVSLGTRFLDSVWIGVGNYQASYRLALHLIRDHGHKRIAYIHGRSGHGEAQERFLAYRDALRECGLAVDEELVVDGDFTEESGRLAVVNLLDERKVGFTAIMAGNDMIALGAVTELRRRGIRIPWDMAITGFDDVDQADIGDLQLTTAHLPLAELMFTGVQALIALNEGELVQPEFTLNSQTRYRFSCGCGGPVEDSQPTAIAREAGYQILAWIDVILGPQANGIDSIYESFRIACVQYLESPKAEIPAGSGAALADALGRVFRQGRIGIDTLRKVQHHLQVFLQRLVGHDQDSEWQNVSRLYRAIQFIVSAELSRVAENERLEFYQYLRFEMAAADSLSGLQTRSELPAAVQGLLDCSEYEYSWLIDAKTSGLILEHSRQGLLARPAGWTKADLYEALPNGLYLGLGLRHENRNFGYWFFAWKDLRFAQLDNIAIQIINAWRVLEANDEVEAANAGQRETVNRINRINLELTTTLDRLHSRQQQLVELRKMEDLNSLILGISAEVDGLLHQAIDSAWLFGEARTQLAAAFQDENLTFAGTARAMTEISNTANMVMQNIDQATGYIDRLRAMAGSQGSEAASGFDLVTVLQNILETNQYLLETAGHRFRFLPNGEGPILMSGWPAVLTKVLALILAFLVKEVLIEYRQQDVAVQAEAAVETVRITISAKGQQLEMDRISLGGLYEIVTQRLGGNLSFGGNAEAGTRFVVVLPRWQGGLAHA